MRIFWYGVAGVVTLSLNPALFTLFHNVLGWVEYGALGASLTLVGILQFLGATSSDFARRIIGRPRRAGRGSRSWARCF